MNTSIKWRFKDNRKDDDTRIAAAGFIILASKILKEKQTKRRF
jgi:hypothetical protein